jgi:beta-glucanase (GH16 family)
MRHITGALGSLMLGACLLTASGTTAPVEAATTPTGNCGTQVLVSDSHTYVCSWNDDFSGRTLDSSHWAPFDTGLNGYTSASYDCYRADTRNISVGSGTLKLTTRRESRPITCKTPGGSFQTRYTSGGVMSWRKFSQTYGRFEFRVAFPTASPGVQSALWMYPQDPAYGAWPSSGEIDVAEYFGTAPAYAIPAVHYDTAVTGDMRSGLGCMPNNPQAFHTYTLEWTPEGMRFLQDGTECWRHTAVADGLLAPAPFDQPFTLLLNQGLGGGDNIASGSTVLPATMTVDYVRVWSLDS